MSNGSVEKEIVILPKESYPLKRIRLTELFMKELVIRNYKIHWILIGNIGNKTTISDNGKNVFHLVNNPWMNNPLITNIIGPLIRIKKYSVLKRVVKENEDINILIANDGIVEGLVTYKISKKKKKIVVFYLSSVFYDMVKNALYRKISVKNIIWYTLELIKLPFRNFIIKKVDIFHPISLGMNDFFNKLRKGKTNLELPLCPANSFFSLPPYSENSLDDVVWMIYIGQITRIRKIEFLIEIVYELRKKIEDKQIKLTLLGKIFDKKYEELLKGKIKEYNLEDCINIIPEVKHEEVPEYIVKANVGLSLLPPIDSFKISSPTKVIEYLSLGIPVVANSEIIDQKEIIINSHGGLSPEYNKKDILESIMYISENNERAIKMGKSGRDWIISNRNYTLLAQKIDELYEEEIKKQLG